MVTRPTRARRAGGAFADLNTAFFEDAIVIDIAPHTIVADPLHVLAIAMPSESTGVPGGLLMSSPRVVIDVGEQAQVSIIESYASTGASFSNAVTDVSVGPGAVVDHVKMQRESAAAFHIATMFVHLDRAANVRVAFGDPGRSE